MTDTMTASEPMPLLDRMNVISGMISGQLGGVNLGTPPSSVATPFNQTDVGAGAVDDPNAITGPPANAPKQTPNPADNITINPGQSSSGAPSSAGDQTYGNVPAHNTNAGNPSGGNAKANQQLGQQLAASYGWDKGDAWTDLNNVVMRESGWIDQKNKTSSASGIGQNINGYSANYQQGNIAQQIQWTYNYIASRYKTPQAAWAHEVQYGWY